MHISNFIHTAWDHFKSYTNEQALQTKRAIAAEIQKEMPAILSKSHVFAQFATDMIEVGAQAAIGAIGDAVKSGLKGLEEKITPTLLEKNNIDKETVKDAFLYVDGKVDKTVIELKKYADRSLPGIEQVVEEKFSNLARVSSQWLIAHLAH